MRHVQLISAPQYRLQDEMLWINRHCWVLNVHVHHYLEAYWQLKGIDRTVVLYKGCEADSCNPTSSVHFYPTSSILEQIWIV